MAGPLAVRTLTAAVLAGVALGLLFWGRLEFFLLVLVAATVAQGELYRATRRAGHEPAATLGLVAGAALLAGTYLRGEAATGLVLFLALAFSFVWFMELDPRRKRGGSAEGHVASIAVTMLGIAYVPLLAAFAILLLARRDGRDVVLALILLVAVYDASAFLAGRQLGRHKLAPAISPGKTWEGAIAATVLTIGLAAAALPRLVHGNEVQAVVLGTVVAAAAPLGDLFESLLKRDLGLKDTGGVLPGHGGVLDRIDALLFCAPATYVSLRLLGL